MDLDAIYADPRLAEVYDDAVGEVPEDRFYLGLAGSSPINVLDLGCGTGRLATAFASNGHAVTGVDPAAPMLRVARSRPGADRVRWVEGDARTVDLAERFDLATMTGNVFQVFLTDDDAAAVIANARRHLAPDGRFVFETRNPLVREWEEWTTEETREVVDVAGVGPVEVAYRLTEVAMPFVTFETMHRFPDGDTAVSPSTLRLRSRDEVADLLARGGATSVEWVGPQGSPLTPESLEIIAIATFR